jgi:hypothetical protein
MDLVASVPCSQAATLDFIMCQLEAAHILARYLCEAHCNTIYA